MTNSTAWTGPSERPEGHALGLLWLRRGVILLCAVVAAILALGVSFLFTPVWEGSAVIRVGQVGQTGAVGQAGAQLVEPIARVVGRVQTRQFQDAVLESSQVSRAETDADARLYRRSLSIKPVATTDLIALQVRARSKDLAARALQATVDQLARVHADLAVPSVRSLQEQAAQVEEQLKTAQAEVDDLRRLEQTKGVASPGSRFEERVFLAGVIARRLEDIRTLSRQRSLMREQLDPARTYSTSVVDPVRVDPKPVSPKPLRNSLLALFVGGLLGALVLLLTDAVRSAREESNVPVPSVPVPHVAAPHVGASSTEAQTRSERVRGER